MTQREIVKAWFSNIDAKNFNAIRILMADNHLFRNPMTPAPIGAEEHIGMMQMMTSAFEGNHHLGQILEDGNHVIVRGHWAGRHIGEFNGVHATGKQVKFSWIDIFEIINGNVVNEYFEMNPMSIMEQIGAMEGQK